MIENSAGWRYVQSADTVADYPTVSEHNAGKFQELKSNVADKAPLTHTHKTSQVTGLDTALSSKAPLATLNTRVPENLALRLDTTVGTRIFAGTTMIHGDTGWRDIKSTFGDNVSFSLPYSVARMRRVGDTVTFQLRLNVVGAKDLSITTPVGFSPPSYISYKYSPTGNTFINVSSLNTSNMVDFVGSAGQSVRVEFSYVTLQSWPTSLPGIPA